MAKIHPFSKRFAKKLRDERLKNNLSQEKLAFKAGVTRNYISMIERGERTPTVTKLYDIAKAMNTEPWELLKC